jgi:hypothetical protein
MPDSRWRKSCIAIVFWGRVWVTGVASGLKDRRLHGAQDYVAEPVVGPFQSSKSNPIDLNYSIYLMGPLPQFGTGKFASQSFCDARTVGTLYLYISRRERSKKRPASRTIQGDLGNEID